MANLIKTIIGGDDFLTETLVRGLTVYGPADAYCIGHCSEQLGKKLQSRNMLQDFAWFVSLG